MQDGILQRSSGDPGTDCCGASAAAPMMSDQSDLSDGKSDHGSGGDRDARAAPAERNGHGDRRTVWAGGLSDNTDESVVRDAFGVFGKIVEEKGVTVRTNQFGTFAFVKFVDEKYAENAINGKDAIIKSLDRPNITLEFAGVARKGKGQERNGGYWNSEKNWDDAYWKVTNGHTYGYSGGWDKNVYHRQGCGGFVNSGDADCDNVIQRHYYNGNGSKGGYQEKCMDKYGGSMGHGLEVSRVWLGGLPNGTKKEDIEPLCTWFGHVEYINVRQSETDTFAFVQYQRKEDAQKCIYKMNGYKIRGWQIKTGVASRKSIKAGKYGSMSWEDGDGGRKHGCHAQSFNEKEDRRGVSDDTRKRSRSPSRRSQQVPERQAYLRSTMVIQNMPKDMKVWEFEDIAADYGEILKLRFEHDKSNNCTKGEIVYVDEHKMDKAILELNGRAVEDWDRKLICFAETRKCS